MNADFFLQIENILHSDRLDVYRQDGADQNLTLARYSLNLALSESLYPSLQFAEIGLRNAVHRALTARCGTEAWYDSPQARLTPWQQEKVDEAKNALAIRRKPLTSGRVVAELNFAFWTGFFNRTHARTGIGAYLSHHAFPHAPAKEQYQATLDRRWQNIRDLRNRVFHHERILHWHDLDQHHQDILDIIGWISPELHDFAKKLDRFTALRQSGLQPWINQIQAHYPASIPATLATASRLTIVDDSFDASMGVETPFGHRWGGDVFTLSQRQLNAIQAGQALALDVMGEYVVFLKAKPEKDADYE